MIGRFDGGERDIRRRDEGIMMRLLLAQWFAIGQGEFYMRKAYFTAFGGLRWCIFSIRAVLLDALGSVGWGQAWT